MNSRVYFQSGLERRRVSPILEPLGRLRHSSPSSCLAIGEELQSSPAIPIGALVRFGLHACLGGGGTLTRGSGGGLGGGGGGGGGGGRGGGIMNQGPQSEPHS
jgi:hypothetical protein